MEKGFLKIISKKQNSLLSAIFVKILIKTDNTGYIM